MRSFQRWRRFSSNVPVINVFSKVRGFDVKMQFEDHNFITRFKTKFCILQTMCSFAWLFWNSRSFGTRIRHRFGTISDTDSALYHAPHHMTSLYHAPHHKAIFDFFWRTRNGHVWRLFLESRTYCTAEKKCKELEFPIISPALTRRELLEFTVLHLHMKV